MSIKIVDGKLVDFPSHRLVHAVVRNKRGVIEEFIDPVEFMTDEEQENGHWIYYLPSELPEAGIEPFSGAEYYAVGYGDLVACDAMMEQLAVFGEDGWVED